MPTYDYRCQSCGERVEVFQRMSDAPMLLCPNCGKKELTRIVTGGAGVIYRGEGWYVTDYSKTSSGGKDEPPKTETKSDAKPATPAAPKADVASKETKSSTSKED